MGLTNEHPIISVQSLNLGVTVKQPMNTWCEGDGWQNIYHYHDKLELIFVDSGSLICGTGKESFKALPGDIIFFSSNTPHYTYTDCNGSSRSYIQFNEEDFSIHGKKYDSLFRFIRGTADSYRHFKPDSPEYGELSVCMKNMFYAYEMNDDFSDYYLLGDIYKLLGILYRNRILINPERQLDMHAVLKITPVLEFIEENYTSKITLEQASAQAGLSPYYFCRLFKKVTDSNFNDYLNFIRILRAEEQLTHSSDSIADIASGTGFTSCAYFNHVFKKLKGCSPSKYRKYKP